MCVFIFTVFFLRVLCFFSYLECVTDADPTSGRQTIAYTTKITFYGMMVAELKEDGHEDIICLRSFYRVLATEFPQIEFVKVYHVPFFISFLYIRIPF